MLANVGTAVVIEASVPVELKTEDVWSAVLEPKIVRELVDEIEELIVVVIELDATVVNEVDEYPED